jgi:Fur family peroxide stress response transcriptional regulator
MERYREIGLKLTPQRLAILEYLDGNTSHPSAEDIYSSVKEKFPTMSFATVYNTLETLRKRGQILELTIDPDRKRYDPNIHPHNHLICLRCKTIVDVDLDFEILIPDEARKSFDVLGNHIEFYGICEKCKKGGE